MKNTKNLINTELRNLNSFNSESEYRTYLSSDSRNDESKSCETLIWENRAGKRDKIKSDVKMSPHKDVSDIPTTPRKSSGANSVVSWDQVCEELRTQATQFFKDNPKAKVAIFSRSELITIINENANREKKDYWTETSKYAKEKTKLADSMSISQARYNGKFNELVKDNADFVRVDRNRRKYLAVKKITK